MMDVSVPLYTSRCSLLMRRESIGNSHGLCQRPEFQSPGRGQGQPNQAVEPPA